jgi:membrane associated rhomboid family serine protease
MAHIAFFFANILIFRDLIICCDCCNNCCTCCRWSLDQLSISYKSVVLQREYWRAGSAALAHADALHFMFNMISVVNLSELEAIYGSLRFDGIYVLIGSPELTSPLCTLRFFSYFSLSCSLVILTSAVVFLLQRGLRLLSTALTAQSLYRRRLAAWLAPRLEGLEDRQAVGYSCVIFAWLVVRAHAGGILNFFSHTGNLSCFLPWHLAGGL